MITTSIKQSKKLVELGIDTSTADMFVSPEGGIANFPILSSEGSSYNEPAWSLSALLELFDDKAGIAKEYNTWFAYDNGRNHCTKHYDNLIDAAFEMVCWLKENKHL